MPRDSTPDTVNSTAGPASRAATRRLAAGDSLALRVTRRGCLICSISIGLAVGAAEESTVRSGARVRDERYEVAVSMRTPCCPSQVDLLVRRLGEEGSYSFRLEERIEEIEGVDLVVGDRAIVRGGLTYGGWTLLIVDLAARLRETALWTYGHALAPAKDRLVYQTHYPRLAGGSRRSIVLLYDLRKTAAENRVGALPRGWPDPNEGRPLFPPQNACTGSTNVALDRQYVVASPFLFSPDGRRVVFLAIDQTDDSAQRSFLVRVDLDGDACQGLAMDELDVRSMIRREHWRGPFRFSASSLRWLDESVQQVVAEQPPGGPFGDRVVLAVP